jgi:uracil-DNA glycosylase
MNWLDVVDYFKTDDFEDIVAALDAIDFKHTLPARENVFRAFRETPFDQVKVVILGQDPYPTKTHAIGLAFSVPPTVNPLPKSLINIHTELEKDTGIHRINGDLTGWTAQGVFLLNTALTVKEGKPGSHAEMWRKFTDNVIERLSEYRENLVFILWGNHAISKARLIDDEKHHVVVSAHPSPLSAYRGFFGSKVFSRTNDYLTSKNITPIKW